MTGPSELRFRVQAYSPDTMPMARLAAYLAELASVLGEPHAVHFVRLEAGSTVIVHRVEPEAVPKVLSRASAVRRGNGPADAMRAYRRINTFMREDNARGALSEQTSGAVIIDFPGREEQEPDFALVSQYGTLDGEVIRIGGPGKSVPVQIKEGDRVFSGCYARRSLAKQLARRLFEPVRLYGMGRWCRTEAGDWELHRFGIDRFEELSNEPLTAVVAALRAIRGSEWSADSLEELETIRGATEEAP